MYSPLGMPFLSLYKYLTLLGYPAQGGDIKAKAKKAVAAGVSTGSKSSPLSALFKALLPLIFVAIAVFLALQLQNSK